MTRESFELHLRETDFMLEHETRKIISRINWIETTLNVNVEKMMESVDGWESLQRTLDELVVNEVKRSLFFNALEKYRVFMLHSDQ